jgi:hypothetical protein
MPRGSFAVLAALSALLIPALAAAQSVERVRVSGPGVTSAFPRGISLELASPPAYARSTAAGTQGRWGGPDYWASEKRDLGGKASIRWSVSFSASASSAKTVALQSPTHGWAIDKKDPLSVTHFVGKRAVGTIPGYYVITRAPAPDDASYEGVLAFPVAPKAFSIARFELTDPATDSAGAFGNYLVGGLDLPSIWNRGQAFWALSGIHLLGNLPPTRVSLADSGHILSGMVADAFRHPVLRVPVSLQRKIGDSWRPLKSTKTDARGLFSVRVGAHGAYRAVASSRGKTVASRAVYFG